MASSIVIRVPIMKFNNDGIIQENNNILFKLGHDDLH